MCFTKYIGNVLRWGRGGSRFLVQLMIAVRPIRVRFPIEITQKKMHIYLPSWGDDLICIYLHRSLVQIVLLSVLVEVVSSASPKARLSQGMQSHEKVHVQLLLNHLKFIKIRCNLVSLSYVSKSLSDRLSTMVKRGYSENASTLKKKIYKHECNFCKCTAHPVIQKHIHKPVYHQNVLFV